LVQQGKTNEIFLTWQWQKVWWDVFGRGTLLLILAEKEGIPVFIAPLFADQGMVFFIGSGGSDYLDFIGHPPDHQSLTEMLNIAKENTPDFEGFLFYHIPEESDTPLILSELARNNGMQICQHDEMLAPKLEMDISTVKLSEAVNKKSLVRHEKWFIRNGVLKICHFQYNKEIQPLLDEFFQQHIDRWIETPYPSQFLKPDERDFFKRLSETLSETGWLRFTSVIWNGIPVAFHFGFNYDGSFFWYKPSFNISFRKYSPGEVLLRNLLIKAIDERAHTFDFGLGDEDFKRRFATKNIKVKSWGLYPG
jgi:CelD/BcsL family acetyltransferase involved in cellulose biosynthesis